MRRREPLVVMLLACLLCLPSCFTTALWSRDCQGGFTTREVVGRIALTPFTLLLDMLTACVQNCGDEHGAHRQRDPRPCR